jgi:hypothetical protein
MPAPNSAAISPAAKVDLKLAAEAAAIVRGVVRPANPVLMVANPSVD